MTLQSPEFLFSFDKDLYQFFQNGFNHIACGRYDFSRGIYVNIEEYCTVLRKEKFFESHRKYYDYQYIIDGTEKIDTKRSEQSRIIRPYNTNNDVEFYSSEVAGVSSVLSQGQGLLIPAGELHIPGLMADAGTSLTIRKAVVKIPASLFHDIKMLVMDVDGTLTDGKIHVGAQGELFKAFNVKDGYGIAVILRDKNIRPAVITGRESCIVAARCSELHIEDCCQGVNDKLVCLCQLAERRGIALSHVAYIGDDVNDLDCMGAVKEAGGITACPRNASAGILNIADYVSSYDGGDGAVRDFIEYLTL